MAVTQAEVAQLVEHVHGKDGVAGSIPAFGSMTFWRKHKALSAFSIAYFLAFTAYFIASANYEFIWYIAVMLGFAWLIAGTEKFSKLPPYLLWMLSFWGLMHMAGGGIFIGDHKLYAQVLIPFYVDGDFTIFKFDQFVHMYGFGVGALVIQYLLRRKIDGSISRFWLGVVSVLAATGLGALNEIVEFIAVLTVPNGVGGYYNNSLDLVFNLIGAVIAVAWSTYFVRRLR